VLHLAAASDSVIVVTTPEPTAVTDGYAFVKVLMQRGYTGQTSLLVNFATDRQEARLTYQRISSVARQFLSAKVLDAGYVLMDPKVREAIKQRQPFVLAYPKCPASRCLAALATRLSAGAALVDRRDGFFKRVARWFG
jgi:flagellar biosynthesis protein FlhG